MSTAESSCTKAQLVGGLQLGNRLLEMKVCFMAKGDRVAGGHHGETVRAARERQLQAGVNTASHPRRVSRHAANLVRNHRGERSRLPSAPRGRFLPISAPHRAGRGSLQQREVRARYDRKRDAAVRAGNRSRAARSPSAPGSGDRDALRRARGRTPARRWASDSAVSPAARVDARVCRGYRNRPRNGRRRRARGIAGGVRIERIREHRRSRQHHRHRVHVRAGTASRRNTLPAIAAGNGETLITNVLATVVRVGEPMKKKTCRRESPETSRAA